MRISHKTNILNLTHDFQPCGDGDVKLLTSSTFKGGEVNIQLDGDVTKQVLITIRANSSDDVMKLLMATDAIRTLARKHNTTPDIHVFMPYLPYARQDYETKPGEALSLKVFANLINSQNFASVTIFDCHSDVGPALINNCVNINNHEFVKGVLADKTNYVIVSPDSGAFKKIQKLCDAIGYLDTPILCNKVRSNNGTIVKTVISESDFGGKDVYIVDDICDGGRTFTSLAGELKTRNVGKVYLIVSHGMFSYGIDPLERGGIAGVFTTDSFCVIRDRYITYTALQPKQWETYYV